MLRRLAQSLRHEALTEIAVLLTLVSHTPLFGAGLLRTMIGSQLDGEAPRSAISFEAKYLISISPVLWSELSARLDRPFDKYENFAAPYARVLLSVPVFRQDTRIQADVRPFLTVLALDRWNSDGARMRAGANGVIRWQAHKNLAIQGEFAPWFELSQYRTSAEGREFSYVGFTEKLSVEWNQSPLFLELGLTAQQSRGGLWHNDFGTIQRAGYRISDAVALGLSHELITARLDESTGSLRNLALFDSRLSRISVFAEFLL